jgi:GGDEF domain-containing protein
MARLKPIAIDLKFGLIVSVIILLLAGIETYSKIEEFKKKIFPDGIKLSWDLVFLITSIVIVATWFIMNNFWQKEYNAHKITKDDRDNLIDDLKRADNARLTDVVTGIPNSISLATDINKYFSKIGSDKHYQFIFIDLKDFRKINKEFGFLKTNDLLRTIAQSIYKRMRRNEDMYKYYDDEERRTYKQEGFYRIYPGGDEFAFIIEGDQADALGFANRLTVQFGDISKKTIEILGRSVPLSFHCSVTEMAPDDTYEVIFKRAQSSYNIAKEGKSDFTICWHPIDREEEIVRTNDRKKNDYSNARKIFEVLTMQDKHLD